MATTNVTLTGHQYTNGGWLPNTNTNAAAAIGTQLAVNIGPSGSNTCRYLIHFKTPTVTGPTTNRSFTFSVGFNIFSSSSATVSYAVTSAGRTQTGWFYDEAPPTAVVSGSFAVSGLSSSPKTFTFTTPNGTFQNNTTYYLWLSSNNRILSTSISNLLSGKMNYTDVTACTAPTSVSLSPSGRDVPGKAATLSWSGASGGVGNAIEAYNIQRWDTGDSAWAAYSVVSGTSTTVYAPTTRGVTRWFRVQAMGTAGSSWYSGFKEAGSTLISNRLPNAPGAEPVGGYTQPSTTSSIKFTITPGSDPDGTTQTVYYSTTSTGSKKSCTSSTSFSLEETGKHTFYFYSYDGIEYSSATVRTITKNAKPTLNSLSVSATPIAGTPTSGSSLGTYVSGSVKGSKTGTFEWRYQTASTISGVPASGNGSWLSTTVPFTYSMDSAVSRGNFFRIGVRLHDGVEYSDTLWHSTVYQRPNPPKSASSITAYNAYSGAYQDNALKTQFSSACSVKWTNPTVSAGYANISSARIIFRTRSPGGSWGVNYTGGDGSNISSGGSNTVNALITPTRGNEVQFGVQIVDVTGGISETWNTILTRALLPVVLDTSITVSVTNNTIRPLSQTYSTSLTWGNATTNSNSPKWVLSAQVNYNGTVHTKYLETALTPSSTATQTLTYTAAASKDKFIDLIPVPQGRNSAYTFTLVARVQNAFGDVSGNIYSSGVTLEYREPPILSAPLNMGIRYNAASTGVTNIKCPLTTNATVRKHTRMINPEEHIVLAFDKATDLNDDITYYEVQYTQADTQPADAATAPTTNSLYSSLVNLYLTNMATGNIPVGGTAISKQYFSFRRPDLDHTKFCWFRMRAVDSQGLTSGWIYSDTFLILSNVTTPSISIQNVSINGSYQLALSYIVPNIGGATFETGSYTYQSYPNLERSVDGITMGVTGKLKIEYCVNGNFSDTAASNYGSQEFTLTAGNFYLEMNGMRDRTSNAIESALRNKRLYLRFLLTITHSPTANTGISSYSNTYIYYVEEPTWSQRPNWFGINTNQNGADEVFKVAAFGSSKTKIRLVGIGNQEIVIDLLTGEVDGAIIDGGTW